MVKKIKRKITKSRYIVVSSFTIMIFLLGMVLGWQFSRHTILKSNEIYEDLKTQLIGLDLKNQIIKQSDICSVPLDSIWEDKITLGKEINRLEDRLGKNDKEVLKQKEYYQLVEIRTWLLSKEIKNNCNSDITLILYFYTNKKDDEKGDFKISEEQGFILDDLYKRYPNQIVIFSFDINTDNPALNSLKEIYNITKVPMVVVNDQTYTRFLSLAQLKSML